MRFDRIMTRRPLVVSPEVPHEEVERLVETARVRHLPLMEDDELVGMWLATEDGPVVLLGPEAVHRTAPGADAEEAIAAILGGREAAVAFDDGRPVGLLTRTDVLGIVRGALARGIGVGAPAAMVVVLTGQAGAGKTTLLMRTIPLLRACEAGVVRADGPPGTPAARGEIDGVPTITDPAAAFRRGLGEAVRALGDVQVVLVEDRDRVPGPGSPGGDVEVVVVPADAVSTLTAAGLREAEAVVVTHIDVAPPGWDPAGAERAVHALHPGIPVFTVATTPDDPGLAAWGDWLLGRVRRRAHR